MSDILSALHFVLGASLVLLASALVPQRLQPAAAAVFCCVGIAVFLGMGMNGSTAMGFGIGAGFCLASLKLATGIRFL